MGQMQQLTKRKLSSNETEKQGKLKETQFRIQEVQFCGDIDIQKGRGNTDGQSS
jgi:hypothetical protein